ncbi:MAG: protoheme IX farnesyltransferase [Bacteroidia bacterium]|nr:protoheme IX farnesyltransferase [Bacteroidia bacterium]
MQEKSLAIPVSATLYNRFQDYLLLTKFRLSSLVVFSASMGYIIAAGTHFSWAILFALMTGGFLVTGASNAFNQIIERDLDALMVRTANRPLPSGRMSIPEGLFSAFAMMIAGVLILWLIINPLCGLLSLISLILYTLIYTPSKRFTSFSVLFGAFPGAFPPLLGWVAEKNAIGPEALLLYGIQFIWQFPHFWAIAWVLNDDYLKAGFRMLPSGEGRTKNDAFQALAYTICLIPLGMLPQFFGFTGILSSALMVACGCLFTVQALRLYTRLDMKSARHLMFGSFIYLPVVQMIWMLDKLLQ